MTTKALAWRQQQLASLTLDRRSGALSQEHETDGVGALAAQGSAQSEAAYELLRVARKHRIEILHARYDWAMPSETRFGVLEVRLPMRASYEQVRAFMESVLTISPNVAVRSLALRAIDDPGRSGLRVQQPAGATAASGELLDVDLQLMVFIPSAGDARLIASGPTKSPSDAGQATRSAPRR